MGDPVYDFLNSGGQTAPASPAASPSGKASNDPVFEFLNSGGKSIPASQEKAPMDAPVVQAAAGYSPSTVFDVANHAFTGIGSGIIGGWRGLTTLASGGTLDDAANAVREEQENRTLQPEAGSKAEKVVEAFGSDYNPLTWIAKGAKKAGEVSQDLGASAGTATAVETGVNAIPMLLGARSVPAKAGVAIERGAPSIASRVEPVLEAPKPELSGAQMEYQAARAKAQAKAEWKDAIQAHDKAARDESVPIAEVRNLGEKATAAEGKYRAAAEAATTKPLELVPDTGRARAESPSRAEAIQDEVPKFLDEAPESATSVDQVQRAKVLQRVGVDTTRKSAISGNAKDAATENQIAKLDGPAGNHMRSVLDNERAALVKYSDDFVSETGGTAGTDGSALYGRGSTIIAPLDALKDLFDRGISGLYKEADKRAQGAPTKLDSFSQVLSDDSLMTNSDRVHLRDSMGAYLKKLGISDTQEITVAQAETIRKRLNENWSPQNSKYTGALKDALDDDVMKAAGEDIYQEARALRAKRARVLDDPKGIAKLMDSSGPDGINRAVPVEKIADTLTGLPADQLAHVIKTLKDVPPELKPQADAALAEVKAQFANKIRDIGGAQTGQWAAKNVTKYLNNNAARLKAIFTPAELDKINDLNSAGHILAKDQSYPGAYAQEHNVIRSGVSKAIIGGAATAADLLLGAPGIGAIAGSALSKAYESKASLKASQKRTVKLSDFPGVNE